MIYNRKTDTATFTATDMRAYRHDRRVQYEPVDEFSDDDREEYFISETYEPFIAWLDRKAHSKDPQVSQKEKDIYARMLERLKEADHLVIYGRNTEPVTSDMFSAVYEDSPEHVERYSDICFDTVTLEDVTEIEPRAFANSFMINKLTVDGDTQLDESAFFDAHMKILSLGDVISDRGPGIIPDSLCFGDDELEEVYWMPTKNTVTKIGDNAFGKCPKLQTLPFQDVQNDSHSSRYVPSEFEEMAKQADETGIDKNNPQKE